MRRKIIILGSGGLAREVALVISHINIKKPTWDIQGFISGSIDDVGQNLGFANVIGDDNWLLNQGFQTDIAIGIGYPQIRAKVILPYLEQKDRFSFPNLIHPSAILDTNRVEFGIGNVFTAGSCFTCDIKIQDFNLFNLNSTIGHDVRIGNYNVINPGVNISGGVKIHNRILIGTGSQILENISIGSAATVGASALVRADVSENQTVVGVPAQPLQKKRQ